ncbi:MAG: hypothetical protein ACRDO2_06270 [Nocardioidaceae bacterium]
MTGATRRAVLRTGAPACLLLLICGCGGSPGGSADLATDTDPGPVPRVSLRGEPDTAALLPDLSRADKAAVARTLRTWLLHGDCRLMADGFLREQTPGTEGDRARRCEAFAVAFTVPALTAADIVVRDVTTRRSGASAVVTDDFSGVEASATLVRTRAGWRIRAWTT